MQVNNTTFTIAEYCAQMDAGTIIINRDYQRSPTVWPPAARSYLIDTILLGYPVPKFSLYQKTDLRTRRTLKEIVDGQQRSKAIQDFYKNEFRLTGKSAFAGLTFSALEEPDQQKFLSYALSVDLFTGATDEDIREVFRRINSYTVPLNPQEKRHAVYQGAFKWFIVGLSEQYAQSLKDIGVFTEAQLSRMSDAAMFTDLCYTHLTGIDNASETKLDSLYRSREPRFPEAETLAQRIGFSLSQILAWEPIHRTALLKPYNFFTLMLAISHTTDPNPVLTAVFKARPLRTFHNDILLTNLSNLAASLESPRPPRDLKDFWEACSKATNRINQRKTRFSWFCKALQPNLL